MKLLAPILAACLVLTSCGIDSEADANASMDSIEALPTTACSTWAADAIAPINGDYSEAVIMSYNAASKFGQLAEEDSSYEYASKAAYTITAFNGFNPANTQSSLKPMLFTAVTDMKRVCQ